MFKTYKAEAENQLNIKIKVIRSNRGEEYDSTALTDFCAQHEIVHQTIAPYKPQQNGVAKRINSMLNGRELPYNIWVEVFLTANYINRIPFKKTKSLYELWKKQISIYKILKYGVALQRS